MAGLLGVIAIGFIILEKSEPIAHIISQKLKRLWVFAELLLFVFVGAQVNIHVALKAGVSRIIGRSSMTGDGFSFQIQDTLCARKGPYAYI